MPYIIHEGDTVVDTLARKIYRRSAWIAFLVFALSLIPVVYCGMFNYASADDFSKSYMIHNVMLAGGNIRDILASAVYASYYQWVKAEGTWASNFFLSMQPSLLGEHAYAITVPLCILYVVIGSGYLFHEILVVSCGVSRRVFWLVLWVQSFLVLQYMPYIRGGMFWYTGMAHYIMPMFFALLMITWMLKWFRTGRRRYYVYMLLGAVYIGGSHYQHILIVLLTFITGWLLSVLHDRDNRRVHLLWIPIAIILAGLYLCVIAPGNAVRGGETFGMHPMAILMMPISCVSMAAQHAVEYIMDTPMLIVYGLMLWCVGQHGMKEGSAAAVRRIPAIVIALYLFLLYASTEAPAIYVADNPEGISGAYYDTVYQSLVLAMTIAIPIVASRVPARFRLGKRTAVIAGVILLILCVKPSIKRSATYTCYDFVRSGGLKDFVIQMEERIELLNDPDLVDVYVPEMNDQQGPFMHLQLAQDADNYTNEATAQFYNKNSVIAVPREEYYAKYSEAQGHDIPEEYRELYSQ